MTKVVESRQLKPGAKRKPTLPKREGRPSAFHPSYCEQAKRYALLGATDRQLAEFFEVAESTINLWKLKHPKFSESIRKGKVQADARVAQSLYNRALGYSHKAVKFFNHGGTIISQEFTEHYPPDTTAAIFFLKNRRPDLWRDKHEHEHGGPGGGPIEVATSTAEELLAELEKRMALKEGA